MAEKTGLDLQEILDNPIVKMAVDDVNRTLTDRRAFMPPICKVFSSKYTTLEETDAYRFSIDREAERQLPKIIRNRVQVVRGNNKAAREAAQRYTAPRRSGIVFSGGPAPGGHNVIAGLYDAAIDDLLARGKERLARLMAHLQSLVQDHAGALEDEATHLEARCTALAADLASAWKRSPRPQTKERSWWSRCWASVSSEVDAAQRSCASACDQLTQETSELTTAMEPLPAGIDAVKAAAERVGMSWS